VAGRTWLAENHPEWLLGGTLLNLGNPDARTWLTDHVDCVIREQGIDLYRQDFNMDPLGFWRRNDLETMRRAVALHPTDYNYSDLNAKQAFHQSLFEWIPYFGSNTMPIGTVDAYGFRSGHAMAVVLGYDLRRKELDYALLRKLTNEWWQVAECYYGDYYPLTPYSRREEGWCAWQFHRPEQGNGMVQAFRRPKSEATTKRFKLHGLDPTAEYEIVNFDVNTPRKATGKELMEQGLLVEIKDKPGAAVVKYRPGS